MDGIIAMFGGERVRRQRRFEHHNGQQDHGIAPQREIVHGLFPPHHLVTGSFLPSVMSVAGTSTNLMANLQGAFQLLASVVAQLRQ